MVRYMRRSVFYNILWSIKRRMSWYAQYKGAEVTARADLSAFADAGSISAYAVESIAWANAKGLISGRSATGLAPQGAATRAEAASILVRFQKNVE